MAQVPEVDSGEGSAVVQQDNEVVLALSEKDTEELNGEFTNNNNPAGSEDSDMEVTRTTE